MAIENEEEQPLDPAMERVRRKMIRLMVISIGIMMIGLMAVLFAIVYKINAPSSRVAEDGVPVEVDLPEGASIVSTDLGEAGILIQLKLSTGETRLVVIDQSNGEIRSQFDLK